MKDTKETKEAKEMKRINGNSENTESAFFSAKETKLTFQQEFDNAIRFAKQAIEDEEKERDKIVILDYVLSVVKEDLKTDLLSYILYNKENFSRELSSPFPLFYTDKNGNKNKVPESGIKTIDLKSDCVLVLPWYRERLYKQIRNLFYHYFTYDRRNHCAYYFPYFELCYASNGTHSVSAGVVYKKGTILATQYDITVLFPHVHTDGASWYNSHNGETAGELDDFRLGIIYELAKLKYEIENNLN